jgi:TPR repeat protein
MTLDDSHRAHPALTKLREAIADPAIEPGRLVARADAVLGLIERGDGLIGLLPAAAIDDVLAAYVRAAASGAAKAAPAMRRMVPVLVGQDLADSAAFASLVAALAALGDRESRLLAARVWMDLGDETNAGRAAALVQSACQADPDGAAHVLLGYMTHRGYGVPSDDAAGLRLHQTAAARGNADALFELGVLAYTGRGVPEDHEAAARWCQEAAAKGHARANYSLGAFYATGDGVPKDASRALACYLAASGAGHGKASAAAGVMCWLGDGTSPDRVRAGVLFDLAEAQGFDPRPLLDEAGIDADEAGLDLDDR